jgi:hypothetical protein
LTGRLTLPQRVILLVAGTSLLWLVATVSLPAALAELSPDTALWLKPSHSRALLNKAEQNRRLLLDALKDTEEIARAVALDFTQSGPPVALDVQAARATQIEARRSEIRTSALLVLRQEPLNARALSLLGEVADNSTEARTFMEAAVKRSRGETRAVAWLLNDSFQRKDFVATIRFADILMRTSPRLRTLATAFLASTGSDELGRQALAAHLMDPANAGVRKMFFQLLPKHVSAPTTAHAIMTALKALGGPPSAAEIKPYLDDLIAKKDIDAAYFAWLDFLPADELSTVSFINNASFEQELSGLPFDWRVASPLNASIDFVPPAPQKSGRAIVIRFGSGRVRFPTVSQFTMLPSGRYRLSVKHRGDVSAKRGLRWRIRCFGKPHPPIGETDMILGQQPNWHTVEVDFEVPATPECRAQQVALIHDARSASEELISGEAWFDDLAIETAPAPSPTPLP